MILKVAWRNIWRAKVRSFIVIGSIATGIWAGLLIIGFSFGMNNERMSLVWSDFQSIIWICTPTPLMGILKILIFQ